MLKKSCKPTILLISASLSHFGFFLASYSSIDANDFWSLLTPLSMSASDGCGNEKHLLPFAQSLIDQRSESDLRLRLSIDEL